MNKNILNKSIVFVISFGLLSIIQIKVENPMILLERFIDGGGWIEIAALSLFAVFLYSKMINPAKTAKWRTISWTIFAVVFFLQFILGLVLSEKFLMSGELHIPVPAIILGGSLFKLRLGFMPLLLIATVLLTGPAWCSQFCYFGAFDNLMAKSKKRPSILKRAFMFRNIILLIFVITVLLFRFFNSSLETAAVFGIGFGIAGLTLILFVTPKKGTMYHCTIYCPIGTLVSYLKYINPFRMYIDSNCNSCMACTSYCRYNALSRDDIKSKKPGFSCTYCGDCINSCHSGSIKYKFFGLNAAEARNLYLIITIAIYVVFLGVAKM